ncbi:MAG: IgGFc-binding protein [Myxococcales bacterium]|nr:IgGFc-binding protein [Myxococcales bacterium]
MRAALVASVCFTLLGGCTRNTPGSGLGSSGGQISFGSDALTPDSAARSPSDADATPLTDAASGDTLHAGDADTYNDVDEVKTDSEPCSLGASRCSSTGRELCGKGGWLPAKCDLIAPVCVDGKCLACTPKMVFCADAPIGVSHSKAVMQCDATGASSKIIEACATGPCEAGKCLACTPGAHRCNANVREVCAGGGQLWSPNHCPATAATCVDGGCKVCKPLAKLCGKNAAGADSVLQCDGSGGWAVPVKECVKPTFCSGGKCVTCVPGSTMCKDGALATCKADGSDYAVSSCPAATPVCVKATCKLCEPSGVFCRAASENAAAAVMTCGPKGNTASAIKACSPDQVCHKNSCKTCVPGLAVCVGATPLLCGVDGTSATVGKRCSETGLNCGETGCECGGKNQSGGGAGTSYCPPPPVGLTTSSSVWSCDAGGKTGKKMKNCPSHQICAGGKCAVCKAGAHRCVGNKAMTCSLSGQGWQLAEDCDTNKQGATVCAAGACVDVCAAKDGNPTSLGCRFWAVDLDNAKITSGGTVFDAQNAPYGVALVNSGLKPSVVTITYGPSASIPVAKTLQLTLAGGAAKSVVLPPPAWKLQPASLDGTSQQGVAFRIDATAPIAAFQHNPLQVNAFSADASRLLPANGLGTSYRVLTRKQSIANLRAYVAVVATRPGTTKVEITTTAATLAGGAIPSLTPGLLHTTSLQQGQVLNLETAKVGDDLTGSLITTNKPVAVFAGAEASHAPDTDTCLSSPTGSGKICVGTNKPCIIAGDCAQTCCADHLEAQLPPISAWGRSFVAGQLQARGGEPSVWRIVAAHNGTTVLLHPSATPVRHLQAGQWFEVLASADMVIESTKPVLVGQFMASSGLTGKSLGDPAFAVLTPVKSLGRAVRFWVPSTYPSNYVTVTSPTSATVSLDAKSLAVGSVIPHTGWSVWRLAVSAGAHSLVSTGPVGAVLHGWSKDGSYAHAAGHGLR